MNQLVHAFMCRLKLLTQVPENKGQETKVVRNRTLKLVTSPHILNSYGTIRRYLKSFAPFFKVQPSVRFFTKLVVVISKVCLDRP